MDRERIGASGAADEPDRGADTTIPTCGGALESEMPTGELECFFLGTLLDTTTDQVYFKDRESRFLRISNTLARRLGLESPAEAVGKTDFDFFTEEHARQAFEDEQLIIRTGEPLIGIEEKETWEDGREAWVSTTKMPLRDESGAIVGTYGVSRDITLEKEQRDEIARHNYLLDTFLESTPEDIYFKDTESRFVRVSRSLMERLGVTRDDEILGKTDYDFFDEEHARQARADEVDIMTTGVPRIAIEERELRPDGSEHWVASSKMPLRDADGTTIGSFGINRDITERKRLEAELRQSQKMEAVGRLAGGIAHDFNNLLMAISGYADLLRQSLSDNEELHGDAEEIIEACERAARLTEELLTFSRGRTPKTEVVDVGGVVERMTEMLSHLLGEDIRIELDICNECTCIRIDPTQLEQVILNLTLNARDAMPSGGRLRVEVRREGTSVHLSVSDSGYGFTPEIKEHLFEPYFTTKQREQGTGLGLATVYAIVQQVGGTIEVEGAPGQGACFHLCLPHADGDCARRTTEAESSRPNVVSRARASNTILVVEDEAAVRTLIGRFLRDAGYSVLTASSAEEALALARDATFELLLSDVVMPGMSGVRLAEQLKQTHPEITVLLISGYSEEHLDSHGAGVYHWPVIQKPFRLPALLELVRAQLQETPPPRRKLALGIRHKVA
jgi:two-component system cell cycle sensor histidine kinase/response regulator CckA